MAQEIEQVVDEIAADLQIVWREMYRRAEYGYVRDYPTISRLEIRTQTLRDLARRLGLESAVKQRIAERRAESMKEALR